MAQAAKNVDLGPDEQVFIISSFKTVKNNKGGGENSKLGKIIEARWKKLSEEEAQKLGGSGGTGGGVLGHEEGGRGVANVGVSVPFENNLSLLVPPVWIVISSVNISTDEPSNLR